MENEKYIYFTQGWLNKTYKENEELGDLKKQTLYADRFVLDSIDNVYYSYVFKNNEGKFFPPENTSIHVKAFRRDVEYDDIEGVPIILNANFAEYEGLPGSVNTQKPFMLMGKGEYDEILAKIFALASVIISAWLEKCATPEQKEAKCLYLHTSNNQLVEEIVPAGYLPKALAYDPKKDEIVMYHAVCWNQKENNKKI